MTEPSDRHIDADDELLARFVMGQMSEAEATAIGKHLASCTTCTRAVEKERLIAAGTRRLGRDLVKASLRQRTMAMSNHALPWPGILSAAAVLGILLGVGWYNGWFAGQHLVPEPLSLRDDRTAAPAPASVTPSPAEKDRSIAQERGHDLGREQGGKLAPGRKGVSAKEPEAAGARGDLALGAAAAAAHGGRDTYAAAQQAITSNVPAPSTYWVEGVQLGAEPVDDLHRRNEAIQTDYQELTTLSKEKKQDLKREQTGGGGLMFRIDQRPVAALPPEGQMRAKPDRVPMSVEQRGDVTVLTLYLDPLLDEREAAGARVDTVAGDSIVVTAGSQRIGLKLPSQFTTQQRTPSR
jgi:hypothetical protein